MTEENLGIVLGAEVYSPCGASPAVDEPCRQTLGNCNLRSTSWLRALRFSGVGSTLTLSNVIEPLHLELRVVEISTSVDLIVSTGTASATWRTR